MAKIYTKTGDTGTSGLIGGTRVPKDDIRLEAYGSLDELGAFISVLLTGNPEPRDREFIQKIQHHLFGMAAYLATDQSSTELKVPKPVTGEMLQCIESEIDAISVALPEIHRFIIPGGNSTSAFCHVCRTICRRAERCVVKVSGEFTVDPDIIRYLNRLSDYFFVLSRKCCLKDGPEHFWDSSK